MGPMTAQDSQTTEQHTHRAWVTPGAMLLVTGCCALVYQVCWLRGLRLVFGASTAANAAVLAINAGKGTKRMGAREMASALDKYRSLGLHDFEKPRDPAEPRAPPRTS